MDGETAFVIGRAFARVLGELRGKPTDSLGIGLGRDMRLTAPEMGGRFAEGLMEEGCHVMDAGEVATEVFYYLVGSRSLDGGAMITPSHNPKPYTGVKLVREGALPLSGDAGIGDVRGADRGGAPREGARRRHDRGRRRAQGVPGGRAGDDPRRRLGEADGASSSTAATAWPGRRSGRCCGI